MSGVLETLLAEAAEDDETLGLLLTGSRADGLADDRSDYDILWVLSDAAYDARRPVHHERAFPGAPPADIGFTSARALEEAERDPGWWTPGLASARVLLDKTGALAPTLERIARMPEERARAEAYESYDAYLNSFVRSTRAWERGHELGARLHAVESIAHLVRAMFALAGRWAPYHDRLGPRLAELEDQGWRPDELEPLLLEIVRSADSSAQRALEARVEWLMESRGVLAHREWGNGLDRARRG